MINFKKLQFKKFFFAATIIVLTGCSETDSENVKTNGLHAEISVTAEGNETTHVKVNLTVGSGLFGTNVELTSGDTLLAHANGITRELGRHSTLFDINYVALFPFDNEGAEFRIEFNRPGDISAPNSVVALPAPFTITTPAGETYAKDAGLTVNWEPAFTTDNMSIKYAIACNSEGIPATYTVRVTDTGQSDIAVSSIIDNAEPALFNDYSRACSLNVAVIRQRNGTIDPGFGEGGKISAEQRRSIDVKIAP